MNKERLLNVAKALRESKNPEVFSMSRFHECGTALCAVGHYAVRRDLQQFMQPDLQASNDALLFGVWGATTRSWDYSGGAWGAISQHFDLSHAEALELFDHSGCGHARTPNEAAAYIKRFVANAL